MNLFDRISFAATCLLSVAGMLLAVTNLTQVGLALGCAGIFTTVVALACYRAPRNERAL